MASASLSAALSRLITGVGVLAGAIKPKNASQARLLQTLPIPDFSSAAVSQCSAAFSPDGNLLAAVCDNSTVPVWEVNSGQLRFTLLDEPSHEVAVTFSPDGSQIAIGGFTGEIRLFDAADAVEKVA